VVRRTARCGNVDDEHGEPHRRWRPKRKGSEVPVFTDRMGRAGLIGGGRTGETTGKAAVAGPGLFR